MVEPICDYVFGSFCCDRCFLALLITGTNLSVTSFLDLIILIGVVVNNAIVLIDYIQLLQQRGMDVISSVILTGQRQTSTCVDHDPNNSRWNVAFGDDQRRGRTTLGTNGQDSIGRTTGIIRLSLSC